MTPAVFTQLKQRTRELQDRFELCQEVEPAERDLLIIRALQWLLSTYDPDRAPDDFRFDVQDVQAAEAKQTGMLSNEAIDVLIDELARHRIHLDRDQFRYVLSLTWCAAAKNIITNNGALPVAGIEGMLRSFWVRDYHLRTLVAVLLRTLEELGQIRCTHRAYGPGFCRRYAISGATGTLPFIARHLADVDRQAVAQFMADVTEQKQLQAGDHVAKSDSAFSRVCGYAWSPSTTLSTPISHRQPMAPLPNALFPIPTSSKMSRMAA